MQQLAGTLVSFLVLLGTFSTQDEERTPRENLLVSLNVVRIDEEKRRLFVAPAHTHLASNSMTARFVGDVAEALARLRPSWEESWAISFFADAGVAGYRSEAARSRRGASTWAHLYLAEYERETGVLVYFPALPQQRRVVSVPTR